MSSDHPTKAELRQIVEDCVAGKRPLSDLAKYGLTIDPPIANLMDKIEVFKPADDEGAPPNMRVKLAPPVE